MILTADLFDPSHRSCTDTSQHSPSGPKAHRSGDVSETKPQSRQGSDPITHKPRAGKLGIRSPTQRFCYAGWVDGGWTQVVFQPPPRLVWKLTNQSSNLLYTLNPKPYTLNPEPLNSTRHTPKPRAARTMRDFRWTWADVGLLKTGL